MTDYSQVHMVASVKVPSMSQIDLFKKLFVFSRTVLKKMLLNNLTKNVNINSIPKPLGIK